MWCRNCIYELCVDVWTGGRFVDGVDVNQQIGAFREHYLSVLVLDVLQCYCKPVVVEVTFVLWETFVVLVSLFNQSEACLFVVHVVKVLQDSWSCYTPGLSSTVVQVYPGISVTSCSITYFASPLVS